MTFRTMIYFVIVICLVLFVVYGRKFYMPLVTKIKGKETVESRVEMLHDDVYRRLLPSFEQIGLTDFPTEIIIVGLKEEKNLEVYGKVENEFKLLKTYPFTAYSGDLGPKLKEGDKQIPEGVYEIEYLNPNSLFYLSMKVNYPNEMDLKHSKFASKAELGTDIFIHGKSVTVGCIPIGDDAIEELFLLVHHAYAQGVKVIISPRDFRKNKSFPQIEAIDWADELYESIEKELTKMSEKG